MQVRVDVGGRKRGCLGGHGGSDGKGGKGFGGSRGLDMFVKDPVVDGAGGLLGRLECKIAIHGMERRIEDGCCVVFFYQEAE